MLKVMIVDDESLFREALKETIPWSELGYEVCCEAENGLDALEKISEYKPDVALVDINMPMMDGIELAAEIKESGADVRVIIITGYSEFDYARKAIEVGVDNYLLKPIDEAQLINVLDSVKKKISIKVEELRKQLTFYKPLLKEMILNNLLYGARIFDKEELSNLEKSFRIDFDNQPYQVIVVEICEKEEYKWYEEERQLWNFAVSNIVNEIFSDVYNYEICRDIHDRICVIANVKPIDMNWHEDILNICERIRVSVKKYLKFSVIIGISDIHKGFRFISQSYNEALYALKNSIVVGEDRVIRYENIKVSDELAIDVYTVEQRRQLLMAARMNKIDEVNEIINSIFNEIRLLNASSDFIVVKCIEIASTCFEFLAETNIKIKCVFGENFNLLKEIQEKKTLDQLESWIKEIFEKSINFRISKSDVQFSKVVADAKRYIDENYNKFDLKIDEIAKNVYVGYGHLCALFKKETGKTINTYITETRINKAKQLLDEGYSNISAVSTMVGYADANYFGKCFKKIYGITPGRYIDEIQSK
ncbi:MAG TPA: response regulator [Clostridiaceae bacterium]|nr:response regulator [Clostridiaceae bacterium]